MDYAHIRLGAEVVHQFSISAALPRSLALLPALGKCLAHLTSSFC
jgi:hypothetical protein